MRARGCGERRAGSSQQAAILALALGRRFPTASQELDPAQLAPGFRAAGVACGLKASGGTDVGLVVCDAPEVASALLLTRNAAAAAPIRVCRDECDRDAIRGVVVNSGNANAATGEQGYRDALAMRDAAAAGSRHRGGRHRRRRNRRDRRAARDRPRARGHLAGGSRARRARWRRLHPGDHDHRQGAEVLHRERRWRHRLGSGQGRGDDRAGLCDPALLRADRRRRSPTPRPRLRQAVQGSFERITVDGQMSTNDTVLLQASRDRRGGRCRMACSDAVLAAARARDRRRRRGREPLGRGSRSAAQPHPTGGRTGRARDRQLAPGQDRASWPRSELGPDRPSRGHGAGG